MCLTLCNPMDYTVCGILQARILEWIDFPFSRAIFPTQGSNPGFPHCRQILYQLRHDRSQIISNTLSCCCCSVAESCPTLCDSIGCSMPSFPVLHYLPEFAQTHVHCDSMNCLLPGSSVHGILLARILDWVAVPSFRGSSRCRDRTCV